MPSSSLMKITLTWLADIHSHNTRYASNLNFYVPRVRSNYGKHTFKFAIDGFHGDFIRLQSQKSKVLRIRIYTRLKTNRK